MDHPKLADHCQTCLQHLSVFGGGRWAKILLTELLKIIPSECKVYWVSHRLHDQCRNWLEENNLDGVVQLVSQHEQLFKKIQAAIIATDVARHFDLCQQLLSRGIPVLCEKPIARSAGELMQLEEIVKGSGVPLGIHLEFTYFQPVAFLAQQFKHRGIDRVEIQWCDPWSEVRDGITKCAEMHANVLEDQLPHVWSLLRTLFEVQSDCLAEQRNKLVVDQVIPQPKGVLIEAQMAGVQLSLGLGHRSQFRKRRLSINQGQGVLDFATLPCSLWIDGQNYDSSQLTQRTLTTSLEGFLQVANRWRIDKAALAERTQPPSRPVWNWPLSLQNNYDLLFESILAADRLFCQQHQQILQIIKNASFDLNDTEHVALVVDCYLPRVPLEERWPRPVSLKDQRIFAARILNRHFGIQAKDGGAWE